MFAKKSFGRLAAPALVATAAACCAPVWADSSNVPFTAQVTTQEVLRSNPGVCFAYPTLAGATTGTGSASHLGAITFTATDCVTPVLPNYTFDNGKLTIVAANGDELRAAYSGTLVPIEGAAPFTLYTINGIFTVTGGTGRFSRASGSGYLQGTENVPTGQGQFNLTGTLTY